MVRKHWDEFILNCINCDGDFLSRYNASRYCGFCNPRKPKPYNTGEYKRVRMKILVRDKKECFYCKGVADCVDHILPISKGGSNDVNNLVASCRRCNSIKNNKVLPVSSRDLPYSPPQKGLDNLNILWYISFNVLWVVYINFSNNRIRQWING